jgi:hypothetical protein
MPNEDYDVTSYFRCRMRMPAEFVSIRVFRKRKSYFWYRLLVGEPQLIIGGARLDRGKIRCVVARLNDLDAGLALQARLRPVPGSL